MPSVEIVYVTPQEEKIARLALDPAAVEGWFNFYIDGKPWGCAKAAQIFARINEVINLKEGK